jgi:hypothetical protein
MGGRLPSWSLSLLGYLGRHPAVCKAKNKPNFSTLLSQVKLLSANDDGAYHSTLYMRNVSSGGGMHQLDDMPPPLRLAGDDISFHRCAP